MRSSRDNSSLLEAYEGLARPLFLSLYHSLRVAAGGELPASERAANQLFPSLSTERLRWKADNFSELFDIVEIIEHAIKHGEISVYRKENADAAPVEINTRAFLNNPLEFMSCLEDMKSDGITYRNIYFKTDELLGIVFKKKSSFYATPARYSAASNRKRPGKTPLKKEKVRLGMLEALRGGETIESLFDRKEDSLAQQYGCSRDTVRRAKAEVRRAHRQK